MPGETHTIARDALLFTKAFDDVKTDTSNSAFDATKTYFTYLVTVDANNSTTVTLASVNENSVVGSKIVEVDSTTQGISYTVDCTSSHNTFTTFYAMATTNNALEDSDIKRMMLNSRFASAVNTINTNETTFTNDFAQITGVLSNVVDIFNKVVPAGTVNYAKVYVYGVDSSGLNHMESKEMLPTRVDATIGQAIQTLNGSVPISESFTSSFINPNASQLTLLIRYKFGSERNTPSGGYTFKFTKGGNMHDMLVSCTVVR